MTLIMSPCPTIHVVMIRCRWRCTAGVDTEALRFLTDGLLAAAPQSGAKKIAPHRDFHTKPIIHTLTALEQESPYIRNGKSFKNFDSGMQ